MLDQWVTAGAAVATAVFTGTILLINRRQLRHSRDVDRAYVSGGGPGNPPHGPFVLCIDNFGRTPATLTEYAVEFCELGAIPARPAYLASGYERTRVRSYVYPPGTRGDEVARIPYHGLQDPVAYGRFWYEDVWRRKHFASFILSLPPRPLPHLDPAYTDWD